MQLEGLIQLNTTKKFSLPRKVLLVGLHGHPHPGEGRDLRVPEEGCGRSTADTSVLDDVLLRQVLGGLDGRHHPLHRQERSLERMLQNERKDKMLLFLGNTNVLP